MAQLTESITSQIPSVKTWKYTVEKVAKGYVRVTVHADNIDDRIRSMIGKNYTKDLNPWARKSRKCRSCDRNLDTHQ